MIVSLSANWKSLLENLKTGNQVFPALWNRPHAVLIPVVLSWFHILFYRRPGDGLLVHLPPRAHWTLRRPVLSGSHWTHTHGSLHQQPSPLQLQSECLHGKLFSWLHWRLRGSAGKNSVKVQDRPQLGANDWKPAVVGSCWEQRRHICPLKQRLSSAALPFLQHLNTINVVLGHLTWLSSEV